MNLVCSQIYNCIWRHAGNGSCPVLTPSMVLSVQVLVCAHASLSLHTHIHTYTHTEAEPCQGRSTCLHYPSSTPPPTLTSTQTSSTSFECISISWCPYELHSAAIQRRVRPRQHPRQSNWLEIELGGEPKRQRLLVGFGLRRWPEVSVWQQGLTSN